MRLVINDLIISGSLLYKRCPIALPTCPVLWPVQSLICCVGFLSLKKILQHRVLFVFDIGCMRCPTQQLIPLPSPNIFGLQLVCFALLSEFMLQSQNCPELLVIWGRGLMPHMIRTDPSRLSRNADWMYFSCICSSPPPAAHHTYRHYKHGSS